MLSIVGSIIISCIITVAVECSVASCFLIKKNEYKYVIIINIITNIIFNSLYHIVLLLSNNIINIIYILIGEIIIFIIEALYYAKHLNLKVNKYIFSLVLNNISFITGLVIYLINRR